MGRSHRDAGWTDADEGGRVLIGREWRPRAKSGFYQFRNLDRRRPGHFGGQKGEEYANVYYVLCAKKRDLAKLNVI